MKALCKPQSHSYPTRSAFEAGTSGPDPGAAEAEQGVEVWLQVGK